MDDGDDDVGWLDNDDSKKKKKELFIDLTDIDNGSKIENWTLMKEMDESTMVRLYEYVYSDSIQEFTFWDEQNGNKMIKMYYLCINNDNDEKTNDNNDNGNIENILESTDDATFVLEGVKKNRKHINI